MGKGDKKSRRGKIHIGSHGVSRPKKSAKAGIPVVQAAVEEKPKKPAKAKVEKPVETPVAEVQPKPKKTTKKAAEKEKSE